jgi:hypothetical protein
MQHLPRMHKAALDSLSSIAKKKKKKKRKEKKKKFWFSFRLDV